MIFLHDQGADPSLDCTEKFAVQLVRIEDDFLNVGADKIMLAYGDQSL